MTAAPLTLSALKTEVSMPALDRTGLIHPHTVEALANLWGLINKINSFHWKVVFRYIKKGCLAKTYFTSSYLPDFEVFKCSAKTRLRQSWDCFLKIISNAHNICSPWGEDKAQNNTFFIIRVFQLSCSKGNKGLWKKINYFIDRCLK